MVLHIICIPCVWYTKLKTLVNLYKECSKILLKLHSFVALKHEITFINRNNIMYHEWSIVH